HRICPARASSSPVSPAQSRSSLRANASISPPARCWPFPATCRTPTRIPTAAAPHTACPQSSSRRLESDPPFATQRSIVMIGYVTLGTNDIKRSAAFYDKLLAEIGAKRLMEFENFIVWGNSPTQAGLSVTKPFDGNPATVGNGVMVALVVKEPAQVDRVYKKALELGAKDEGAAGPRGPGFYAGYFRDPDGNKLNCFCAT